MLEHIHHFFGIIGAGIAGLGLAVLGVKAKMKPKAQDPVEPAAPLPAPEPASPMVPPPPPPAPTSASDGLTANACMELISHESIVLEAYKDSQEIWTWGIGVTDASGHNVERYIDNPQSIEHVLDIFIWLLRGVYLPAVKRVFSGYTLSEAQLAAALSFHYNTGAIGRATWVSLWKSGHPDMARTHFMDWVHPASVTERRQEECNLFFDDTWSNNGTALVIPVSKPSYHPDFHHAARVNIMPQLQQLLG